MAVELRKNKRFPSHLPARIVSVDGQVYQCTVVDYSHSGIRLHWHQAGIEHMPGPLTLEIDLEQSASILVDFVYQRDDFVGFRIHEPNDQLFLEIQEYTHRHGASRSVSDEEAESYRQLMVEETRMLSEALPGRWASAFIDETGTFSDRSRTTDEHRQWLEAAESVRNKRHEFMQEFSSRIAAQLQRWCHGEAKKTDEETRSETIITLSLVHQKDFEDWLRTKVTISHLQAHLARREFEVKQYFHAVFPGPEIHRFNPLDPLLITEAFRDSIPLLELPRPCREPAFGVFERIALEMLSATYRVILDKVDIPLNFLFRREPANDVASPMAASGSSAVSSAPGHDADCDGKADTDEDSSQSAVEGGHLAQAQPDEPSADSAAHSEGGSSAVRGEEKTEQINDTPPDNLVIWPGTPKAREQAERSYSSIGQLLSLRPSLHPQSGEADSDGLAGVAASEDGYASDDQSVDGISSQRAPAGLPLASATEILDVVNRLAKKHDGLPEGVRAVIDKELVGQFMRLPEDTSSAIETLEQITTNLLENEELAEFIRPSIRQISWPLLRLVLSDPAALFNSEHPARILITVLGQLGRLTLVGQDQLQLELEKLIDPLASSEECDLALFEQLLEQLRYLLDNAERRVKQNTERVAQAAEGEYQIYRARQNVQNMLGLDTSAKTLPQSVVDWLYEGWQQILSIHCLREGPDSERFQSAVNLYREIIEVFSPANRGQSKLLQSFIPLAEQARAELDELNGPLPDHQKWYRSMLTSAGMHLSGGQVPEPVEMKSYTEVVDDTTGAGKGARRVRSLETGDRLQMRDSGQIVSIAWIAEDHSRIACVNHTGMRMHDFRFDELAKLMEKDDVRRLFEQEESTLDQSIDSLVQQIYSDLSRQANTDSLTGLINRPHFIHLLTAVMQEHNRNRRPLSLILFDIHQLRVINQSYGLLTGDECLKSVADQLLKQYPGKLCARISDSSYALLLPDQDLELAESSARQFLKEVEQAPVKTSGGMDIHPELCAGVTTLTADTSDALDLVEQAQSASQEALVGTHGAVVRYQFQHSPRNRYREFTDWRERMDRALQADTLSLILIPVKAVQLRYKTLLQYEVVCQLPEGEGGRLPPDEVRFSNTGGFNQAYEMDRWMVRRLVGWMKENPQQAAGVRRFLIRISGLCLVDGSLSGYLRHQLETHDVPVNKFCFELNEASIRGDMNSTAEHMHELRSLGCQFVLSDFGTGQASYSTLKALPVDLVKIDSNLIQDLHTSSADYALVKSIQEIARFMAKKTIAEYTDNDLAWEILRGIGVDFSSGSMQSAMLLEELEVPQES